MIKSNCRLIHKILREETHLPRAGVWIETCMEPSTRLELVNLVLTKDALYQTELQGLKKQETRLELATTTLEGWGSTKLSYSCFETNLGRKA